MTDTTKEDVAHLRRAGTSLLLRLPADELPTVLHWGPDLGEATPGAHELLTAVAVPLTDSQLTTMERVSVLPQHSTGWMGVPGLTGSRAGRAWSLVLGPVTHQVQDAGTDSWPDGPEGTARVLSTGVDAPGGLRVTSEVHLGPTGLVRARARVTNLHGEPYEVGALTVSLPVPPQAEELLDLTGRHTHERHPQRHPFPVGAWVREARGGRPGLDAATMLCAGVGGFAFRSGQVWGVHLEWSGNQRLVAERTVTGWRLLGGGELLLPGEVRLERDETYTSPWLCASWGDGLDVLSSRVHRHLRRRPHHPRRPRPVLLNTWEAVYFDHDTDKLLRLAENAAAVGVERFVLDDGWFRGRRDDRAGLGDWVVDPDVWPDGLTPLAGRVHELGMEFGLWFEPEMVNLDSDLARAHPDWLLGTPHGPGSPSRYQHVLDLGRPEAYEHVRHQMSQVIGRYGVDYIKWDHNRPLVDAGHQPDGQPAVREQTLAVYRLMRALKDAHPGLEIESCAAGGGRIDLGVLEVADRVWVSDCIDPHERHRMVRWTGLITPPELMGTHIGSPVDHTTGRTHTLPFRAATALWGHLGIEWDIADLGADDLAELTAWVQLHKRHRQLLHTGDVVHADTHATEISLEGVVAEDGSEALFQVSLLEHPLTWPLQRLRLPGLDPHRSYRVTIAQPRESRPAESRLPAWTRDGAVLTGAMLHGLGLAAPMLRLHEALLIHVSAEPLPTGP
ncbi:alpha-galactosidase [Aquipuribacter hungaricus]|uniref:Alpha-galactosidase n=1 Tax=Aquipuribacter hungaricus TaxID=545624 RepID=A0ABV7WMN4_9MICO